MATMNVIATFLLDAKSYVATVSVPTTSSVIGVTENSGKIEVHYAYLVGSGNSSQKLQVIKKGETIFQGRTCIGGCMVNKNGVYTPFFVCTTWGVR